VIGARALAALALAAGLLGASAPAAKGTLAPAPSATPAPIVDRYLAALADLPVPPYVSFEYTVEQSGGTNISQVHRIYRAGREERDELIEEDGYRLKRPRVRIRHAAGDRYALAALAPTRERYVFALVGTAKSGEHLAYTYHTEARSAAQFVVDEVTIDGASFLPTHLRFRSAAGGVHGHGTFVYGKTGKYWLIREAHIDALRKDDAIRERIVWSAYRFPSSLPSATFADQVAEPSPAPSAALP
jgi:hypothetical protein